MAKNLADNLVACVSLVDELEIIPAYYSDGNYIELSAEDSPEEVVIVTSENERVIEVAQTESNTNGRVEVVNDKCLDAHQIRPDCYDTGNN